MPTFQDLWDNYPTGDAPCSTNGVRNFENQCAIRIGVCFKNAGLDTKSLHVPRCWQHPREENHILRAESLADALDRRTIPGLGKTEKYSGKIGYDKIKGRKGIVFFGNFWGQGMQGDHIDLWNGSGTRILWRSFIYNTLLRGYKYKQGKIWFWQLL